MWSQCGVALTVWLVLDKNEDSSVEYRCRSRSKTPPTVTQGAVTTIPVTYFKLASLLGTAGDGFPRASKAPTLQLEGCKQRAWGPKLH